jgi:hypothetical protein
MLQRKKFEALGFDSIKAEGLAFIFMRLGLTPSPLFT